MTAKKDDHKAPHAADATGKDKPGQPGAMPGTPTSPAEAADGPPEHAKGSNEGPPRHQPRPVHDGEGNVTGYGPGGPVGAAPTHHGHAQNPHPMVYAREQRSQRPEFADAVEKVAAAMKKFCEAGVGGQFAAQAAFDLYRFCQGRDY